MGEPRALLPLPLQAPLGVGALVTRETTGGWGRGAGLHGGHHQGGIGRLQPTPHKGGNTIE